MSQLIELKIDVTKIDKKKLFEGKNGSKYLTVTASVNDSLDQFGQDVSVYEAQTEDERKEKKNKNFLGNGKTFWADGGVKTAKDKAGRDAQSNTNSAPDSFDAPDDDLPF